MKKLLLVGLLAAVALAAVWYLQPQLIRPLLEHTPLKDHVSTSTPVYQWRDAEGSWQVTDEPPPDGIPYEVKRYSLDANILPPFPGTGEDD
jgi:hypothetical protein